MLHYSFKDDDQASSIASFIMKIGKVDSAGRTPGITDLADRIFHMYSEENILLII